MRRGCKLKMSTLKLVFAITLTVFGSSQAAECHGGPNPNARPNLNPIQTAPPKFVKSVKNGKLYTVGDGDDMIHVVHVWGSPYEMGLAQGQLMTQKVQGLIDDVWNYLEEQVEKAINSTTSIFPEWFLKDVANLGLDVALDLEIFVTEKYTGDYFLPEIKGLADATGLDYKKIQRIHLVGELTKAHCSMFGVNGSATPDGSLLQLRAFDWIVDGPFKNYPQITVYHPSSDNGHTFANIGWTGWIGSVTGMSSVKMAISQIGVSCPDDTFGKESRVGVPFTYLLRDILQFDKTLDEAMDRISNAHRTCYLILGVGDWKANQFRGVQYSAEVANFFTPNDLEPEGDWHPRIKDSVYWGMDWWIPGYNKALGKQLALYHGNTTAENTIRNIVPIVQTGNLQVAIYDFPKDFLYVANARADWESGPLNAYDRSFVQLNTSALFAETLPSV